MKFAMKAAAAVCALAFSLSVVPMAHADTSHDDKKFLEDASHGNLAEVKMAQLALQRSSNKEVREFAQKMIHDHTMLQQNMKPFAQKMGVPPPTKMERSEQDEFDRLAGKKGESFDKDYITTMVDDHHHDLMAFDKEIQSTDNVQFKAAVEKGRAVIAEHNKIIDGIAEQFHIAVPNQ